MLAALVTAVWVLVGGDGLPHQWWTAIHVVTLGVLTNGILQWSWYFARSLLHLGPHDRRAGRDATVRSVALNVAIVGLVVSMWTHVAPAVVVFAALLGAIVAWHGLALAQAARGALGSAHGVVIRFYVAAAAMFVLGCAIAGLLTVALLDPGAPAWLTGARDQLSLAHAIIMGAGWIGLSISGTLVTLGPTMLRTRIDPAAVPRAVRALPALVVLVGAAGLAAALGSTQLAGALLAGFGGVVVWAIALPLARVALGKGPREHPAWSMTGGLAWIAFGIGAISVSLMRAGDPAQARADAAAWLPLLGAGGIAQVFVGALAYLLPVVVGGGPSAVRLGIGTLEHLSPLRLGARFAALAALAVSVNTAVPLRGVWWGVVIATFAVDIGLLGAAGVRQSRAKRAALTTQAAP